MTVEDPIEFLHRHKRSMINQREVGADTHSFANALRSVLRQDPDVILVGEMRDLETMQIALTAAETGHLVFATLHTSDAPQTIDRIIDVFPPHQQEQVRIMLANGLQGVCCQQLVPTISGSRVVACEVLMPTPAVRNLIREGKTHQIYSVMQTGSSHGMQTMDATLAALVRQGDHHPGHGPRARRPPRRAEASARAGEGRMSATFVYKALDRAGGSHDRRDRRRLEGRRRRPAAAARPHGGGRQPEVDDPDGGGAARPLPRPQVAPRHGHRPPARDHDLQRPLAPARALRARGADRGAQAQARDHRRPPGRRGRPRPLAGDGQAPQGLLGPLRRDGARRRDRRKPGGGARAGRDPAREGRPPQAHRALGDGLPDPDRRLRGRRADRDGAVHHPDLRRHVQGPRRQAAGPDPVHDRPLRRDEDLLVPHDRRADRRS